MLEIVTGIAGTGKTEYCLERYRDAIHQSNLQGKLGVTLWITPTHRSGQAVLKEILNAELTCCWSPGVLTFDQFAGQVLQGGGISASMLNPAQRRMLIGSVIRNIDQQEKLNYFHQISETSGFINLVSKFITDLKREETWPQDFHDAVQKRDFSPKDHELHRIYDSYQDKMRKWDRYDAEGQYWLARSELARGNWQAFPELTMVVVDGFTNFTSTQSEMLNLLAERAQTMLVTVPCDPADTRQELFAQPEAASSILKSFSGSFETKQVKKRVQQDEKLPEGLLAVRSKLFENPRQLTRSHNAQGVSCFTTLGPRAEIREVARRVKRLLLDGIPADQILVTARDLESQQNLIEEIWSDAGIPCFLKTTQKVMSLPLARAIIAMLRLELENWSFASIKNLLRYLRMTLPADSGFEYRARTCLNAVRSLNLRSGRHEILRMLEHRASREPSSYDALGADDYALAYEALHELQQNLSSLNLSRSYYEQVMNLLASGRELFFGAENSARNQTGSHDQASSFSQQWDFIAGMLREASLFQDQLLEQQSPKVTFLAFAAWVEEQLRSQTIPAPRALPGDVMILPASDARHLSAPYLFVIGLQEGSFPQGGTQQPFYSEKERRKWNELGVRLSVHESQYQEEMQFFYRLVTRASQQLTLSYSRVSNKGQPLYSSPFYRSALSLFTADAIQEEEIGQLSPVPQSGNLLTLSEIRMNAVEQMFEGRAGLLKWWSQTSAMPLSCSSFLASVGMNAYRFEQPGFSMFDGMLSVQENLNALQTHYNSEYTFSATKLESYAQCPFRFFMDSVLKMNPVQNPKLATDYLKRGNIVHDVLSQLHETDWSDFPDRDAEKSPQLLAEKFLELLAEKYEINYPRGELQEVLDQIERNLITEWGELYCDQAVSYTQELDSIWEQPPATQYRELTFGRAEINPDDQENISNQPASLPAIQFGTSQEKVKVEGRIDRIDVGKIDGQDVFTIIDYKTGSVPRVKTEDVSTGTGLQLALYAVAVMRLKLLGPDAVPWQVGYWGIKEKGYEPKFVSTRKKVPEQLTQEVLAAWEQELDRIVPEMVQSIRGGEFPVFSSDKKCTERCEYSTICRVNQIRSLPTALEKNWSFKKDID